MIVSIWAALVLLVDLHIMRMAPFYKLAGPNGMSRDDLLFRDATSYMTYLKIPHKAGVLVWLSGFISILVPTASVLQSLVFQSTNPPDSRLQGDAYMKEAAQRVSKVVVSRTGAALLTTICALVAVAHLWLLMLLSYKKSGVDHDPEGWRGVYPLVRNNIQSIQQSRRVRLENGTLQAFSSGAEKYSTRDDGDEHWGRRVKTLFGFTMIYSLFLLLFNSITPVTNAVWSLRRVPWLSLFFTACFQFLWSRCDMALRVATPWIQLHWYEPLSENIIDYTALPTPIVSIKSFQKGRPTLGLFDLASILMPFLVVAVSSASEISAYTFVLRDTYQDPNLPGYAGVMTTLTWAGNKATGSLQEAAWVFGGWLLVSCSSHF